MATTTKRFSLKASPTERKVELALFDPFPLQGTGLSHVRRNIYLTLSADGDKVKEQRVYVILTGMRWADTTCTDSMYVVGEVRENVSHLFDYESYDRFEFRAHLGPQHRGGNWVDLIGVRTPTGTDSADKPYMGVDGFDPVC